MTRLEAVAKLREHAGEDAHVRLYSSDGGACLSWRVPGEPDADRPHAVKVPLSKGVFRAMERRGELASRRSFAEGAYRYVRYDLAPAPASLS